MSEYVCNTHALHWHLFGDTRLSAAARECLLGANRGAHRIHVSAISLVELVYLLERGRLDAELVERAFALLEAGDGSYVTTPCDRATALALRRVPRADIADMPDRIIVATALQLGLPLITRDEAIRRSGVVPTVW